MIPLLAAQDFENLREAVDAVERTIKGLKLARGSSYHSASGNKATNPKGTTNGSRKCHNCGEVGHLVKDCPAKKNKTTKDNENKVDKD